MKDLTLPQPSTAKIDNFGPVQAAIDSQTRKITLRLKRGANPLSPNAVAKCVAWALTTSQGRYPDYELVLDGVDYAEKVDNHTILYTLKCKEITLSEAAKT